VNKEGKKDSCHWRRRGRLTDAALHKLSYPTVFLSSFPILGRLNLVKRGRKEGDREE